MIAEPIIGLDIPNAFQIHIGYNGVFSMLRLTNAESHDMWTISKWQRLALGVHKVYWFQEYGQFSVEQFMSHLIDNYPDHAEWLLFHPEWL